MRVNDLLRMELMAECLEAACIFSTGEAMEPKLISNFAAAAFCAKDFGTSSEGSSCRSAGSDALIRFK